MAYFNGKRVLFSPTVNISEAQGVPNIPETTTTWAGLFDLANGVYIVPERTENKIYFPDTFIVPENEVKGLIEVQDGKIYFYRSEVFAEKNADNSVFWQVKKLLDEYVDLDGFIDSGATDGIYYSQMAVPITNDTQGRNLYGLFELVRDNIDGKGQIISYYWGLEITWNAEATAPRSFTVIRNPLSLSDTDKTKDAVLIQHNYYSDTQTEGYVARSIDVNNLSESGLAALNIPTSKAVAQYVKNAVANKADINNPLQLSDTDITKAGVLIQHNYDGTPGGKYIARSIDTSNLSESGSTMLNIPTSFAVRNYVKEAINSAITTALNTEV